MECPCGGETKELQADLVKYQSCKICGRNYMPKHDYPHRSDGEPTPRKAK